MHNEKSELISTKWSCEMFIVLLKKNGIKQWVALDANF